MDRGKSTNTPSRSDANFSENTFSDCKLNVGPQNTHYHERNTYNLTVNVRVPAIETRQPSRERATDDSEALPRKDEGECSLEATYKAPSSGSWLCMLAIKVMNVLFICRTSYRSVLYRRTAYSNV